MQNEVEFVRRCMDATPRDLKIKKEKKRGRIKAF